MLPLDAPFARGEEKWFPCCRKDHSARRIGLYRAAQKRRFCNEVQSEVATPDVAEEHCEKVQAEGPPKKGDRRWNLNM